MTYDRLCQSLAIHGLIPRGGFHPREDDGLGPDAGSVVLVGNAGATMWEAFSAARGGEKDPMNAWSRRVIGAIAEAFGARALYPFDGPPWWPFQRWAQRAEAVFPSPVGMLIHPDHGLWHAYRGALVFSEPVAGLPSREEAPSPCDTCQGKPCLDACPAGAFTDTGYDVPACAAHLASPAGSDCMSLGCRARRACPVGQMSAYVPDQALFHMDAFLKSRPRL